jgi:hypothetical protein
MIPLTWKLVIDCANPNQQAAFWAQALGYIVEDNSALIERLRRFGAIGEGDITTVEGRAAWKELAAVTDRGSSTRPVKHEAVGRGVDPDAPKPA